MRSPILLATALVGCFPSSPSPPPGPPPAPVGLAPVAATAAPAALPVRIEVVLEPVKADGRAWDAGGEAPDLALCLTSGGATKCLPAGTSVSSVTAPACRDAFRCSFAEVALAPGSFQVQVIDVDALANDLAGEGACQVGGVCRIGQATLTAVSATPGLGSPVAAAPPAAPGVTGAVPPKAQMAIARLRQAIAARDMLGLRGLLSDDGEFSVGPGLVAESGQAAAEAWRANPASLADLDRVLAMGCSAEEDDGMVIVTCPRETSDEYEGPVAVLAEEDEDTYQLAGFIRP